MRDRSCIECRRGWPGAAPARALLCAALLLSALRAGPAAALGAAADRDPVSVVASLTSYASIAQEVVGERGRVRPIAEARQDAHFVSPRPSYAVMVRKADLLLTTGLDLELWMPTLIDASRNSRIREGQPGYVSLATGVPMLQVPDNPSRAAGEIHIYGNPHIHTDPLRAVIIANNVRTGLINVDPEGAAYYTRQFQEFERRVHEALYGPELVALVGGGKLAQLDMLGRLHTFLEGTTMGGEPLAARLGGWHREAACLRGKRIIAYHLNWIYFVSRFGIRIVEYIEHRPGIPPSAAHVAHVIELARREGIRALLVANHFDERIPHLVAERTGATFLYVPLEVGGDPEAPDYFSLVGLWIRSLKSAFPDCQAG